MRRSTLGCVMVELTYSELVVLYSSMPFRAGAVMLETVVAGVTCSLVVSVPTHITSG